MVTVTIPPARAVLDEDERLYLVGLHEGPDGTPPAWNVTLAGVAFSYVTTTFDGQGNPVARSGALVKLGRARLRQIQEAVARRVVRWIRNRRTGKLLRAQILDVHAIGFVPERDDEPLERYLRIEVAPTALAGPPAAFTDVVARALEEAKAGEARAEADPRDARLRAEHGRAKKAGVPLESPAG